jgi:hypothetical protein
VSVTEVTEVAKPRRGRQTVRDMVLSLGLMAVVIGVSLLFVPSLIHPSSQDRYPAFDNSGVVEGFHQVTGVNPLVPGALPSDWRATSGTLTGPRAREHMHLGYAAPGRSYAGLEESVGPAADLVSTVLGKAGTTVTGTVAVNGVGWQRRPAPGGEVALMHVSGSLTVIVTGSASVPDLVRFAAGLHS